MTTIALVSCVSMKQLVLAKAQDLYTSPLFRGMRAYAETHADEWYILSAQHGLVAPNVVIEPYDRTLREMNRWERTAWAVGVQQQLDPVSILPRGAEVLMLAGERYREQLVPWIRARGHVVRIPLEGLTIGRQLHILWSKDHDDHHAHPIHAR